MAPRGRPPSRTSRMNAAIEAMLPFGFTKDVVVAKMRELLEEYDGQYGFIELDAYTVLLESLIADQDDGNSNHQNQEQIVHGETSNAIEIVESQKGEEAHGIVPTSNFIDIPVCSSSPLPIIPPPPPPPSYPPPPPPPPPPVMAAAPEPPPETAQPRRRKPCHGWIGDSDDDDDSDDDWKFINLIPSSFNHQISKTPPTTQPELTGEEKNRRKRKSRWDLGPEDMEL